MKKTLFAISAIAVLLGFTACTSDEIVEPQVSGKTITISASTESSATRTALADDGEGGYDVVWSTGDVITIGDKTFTLSSTPGTTKGTFTGKDPANGKFDVWYGISSASLPAMQTYKAGEITNSPMHASVDITDGVASIVDFKNLCGLFKLSLKGTATVKSITISANEPVAGEFTVGTDGGAVLEESADDKSITLDCGDGVTLTESATDFFIAMPAGTYTGVSITLTDDEGKVCVKKLRSTKNLVITRSNITPASFTASSFKPTITASSPVGTIGVLDGREGIVVDLGGTIGKVVIATMNVGATSVDYATAANNATCYGVQYDEYDASDPSKMGLTGGWSAPTPSELEALYNLTGGAWSAADYDNHKAAGYAWTIGSGENQNTLFFPAAGYCNGNQMGINCSYRSQIGSVYEYEEEMEIYNLLDIYETTKSLYDEFPGCKNCYSVRPFHAMPEAPASSYNMGDRVTLDGHEGIVVDLGETLGKVVVATMNVEATVVKGSDDCLGTKMTYDEACDAIWSGWRLPTLEEMETLCSVDYPGVCGDTEVGGHNVPMMMWDLDGNEEIDLYLPLNDYYFDGENSFPFDKYWTRTTKDGGNSYYYFAPEIDWEGDGENTYFPIDYDFREVYKEAVDKTDTNNKFLVRLFHDLP